MKRRMVSAMALMLLLTGMLMFAFNIQPVKAESTTIIVPDDYPTIQAAVNVATPGDTIIVREGNYTENVDVNKDHLTIRSEKGAANTVVQAANSSDHVFEITADYVNVIGFTVTKAVVVNKAGIFLYYADYCNISDNKALGNDGGIWLHTSSNNILSNNIASNGRDGISLWPAFNNNTLTNNTMSENYYNFGIYPYSLSDCIQNIDSSNKINGKPIYYWVGQHNKQVPSDAGFVGIVNCTNIIVESLNLTNNVQGVFFAYSNDSRIENVNASNNGYGVWLEFSHNITVANDKVISNGRGIDAWYSTNNRFYLNNFVNYEYNVYSYDSTNIWSSPAAMTYIYNGRVYTNHLGNYWSDYIGSDANEDGIGDTPYSINSDKDNYPLMEPFENYIQPRYVIGVDVSEFQCGPPLINWSKVHDSGVEFAYVRATLGDNRPPTLIDKNFTINMMNAKEAGLLVGAYHVAYADRNDAVDEAEFFLSVAGNYTKAGYLRPMLDLEQEILNNIMAEKGPEAGKLYLQLWVQVWASKVENETGQVPILYMGKYAAANYFNQSFRKYDLWIVDWTYNLTTPPSSIGIWEKWVFWQYSNNSHVDGITGFVDCDAFNGDINLLRDTVLIKTPGKVITVPDDYATIQEAINNAADGDTVFVRNGTYYEDVVANKTVSLVGENVRSTVINGSGSGNVVMIGANNVNVSGFTIRNSGTYPAAGVRLGTASHCNIAGNNITNNGNGVYLAYFSSYTVVSGNNITANIWGVSLDYSSHNTVSGNNITANRTYGVVMRDSSNNTVSGNNIINNWVGFCLAYSSNYTVVSGNNITANDLHGVLLYSSCNYNIVSGNSITNNGVGLYVWSSSSYNAVSGNNITDNSDGIVLEYSCSNNGVSGNNISANTVRGIWLDSSSDNTIYHNNLINNTSQVSSSNSTNVWDDGYPSGGNYWSNYAGVDLHSGSGQDETGSDGIGDTFQVIDGNNVDHYPLMAPFNTFDAGTWNGTAYNVDVVSNSTVSGFHFNPEEGSFLKFNVTGEEGTVGFCRVTIPKGLLWVEDGWTVYAEEESVNCTIIPDNDYTYLYFTYNHSTKAIVIQGTHVIQESPSFLILSPLFMIATLLAVIAYKRKRVDVT
jgi:parallel beta-helix repeat protein